MPEPQVLSQDQFFQKFPSLDDDPENIVRSTAQQYGIDPDHFARMAKQESGFQPDIVSKKGAVGLMQLMPDTAKRFGVKDPTDPRQNAEGGAQYFKELLGQFGGDYRKATIAYNGGPAVAAGLKPMPKETSNYVSAIMGNDKPVATRPGEVRLSEDEYNKRYGSPTISEPTAATTPTQPSGPFGVPDFWRSLMASVGGPITQYAFDPSYRKTINENIPSLAAGAAASAIPGAEEFAPGAFAGSPLLANLANRALIPAIRGAAAGGGYALGKLGQYGAEGRLPTKEEFAQIGPEAGVQGALQGIFELPGMLFGPAEQVAYNRYRGFLNPTVAEEGKDVVKTGLEYNIPLNKNSASAAREEINGLNKTADKIYAAKGGNWFHDKDELKKAYDAVRDSDPGAFASTKEAYNKVWNDAMAGKPQEIQLGVGRRIKTNATQKVEYGEIGTPEREARKALNRVIGESENNIDPRFGPINQERKKLIDFEESAEKFVNSQYRTPLSQRIVPPLIRGGIGGGAAAGIVHDPVTAAVTAGVTAATLSPRLQSRVTQFLAQHPEMTKQTLAFLTRKLTEGGEDKGQKAIDNLSDFKVNLMNSPFAQALTNRGQEGQTQIRYQGPGSE